MIRGRSKARAVDGAGSKIEAPKLGGSNQRRRSIRVGRFKLSTRFGPRQIQKSEFGWFSAGAVGPVKLPFRAALTIPNSKSSPDTGAVAMIGFEAQLRSSRGPGLQGVLRLRWSLAGQSRGSVDLEVCLYW